MTTHQGYQYPKKEKKTIQEYQYPQKGKKIVHQRY